MNRFAGNISRQDRLWAMADHGAGLEHVPFFVLFASWRSGNQCPITASGLGSTWLRMAAVVQATEDDPSDKLVPDGPVMHRAHWCRPISTVQKSFHVESLFTPKHVIDGASEFVGQRGQSFRLAVFLFQPGQIRLALRVVAEEPDGGFRKSPLQMRVADLVARCAVEFYSGFFLRFHQPAVGSEILDAGEA